MRLSTYIGAVTRIGLRWTLSAQRNSKREPALIVGQDSAVQLSATTPYKIDTVLYMSTATDRIGCVGESNRTREYLTNDCAQNEVAHD